MLKSLALSFALLIAPLSHALAQACATYPNTLTNGATADANQVMANFNCAALTGAGRFTAPVGIETTSPSDALDVAAPVVFGGPPERLSLNTGSIGFNRQVATGLIYNTSAYAYQFQHLGSTSPASDSLLLQVYSPSGSTVSGAAIAVNGYGGVSIEGGPQSGWNFTANGQAGGSTAWATYSDARLKQDVTPITDALSVVQQLQGVRYHFRAAPDREVGKTLKLPATTEPQIGFLAQDVAKVVPEAVVAPGSGPDDVYGMVDTKLIPVLVEAIKQQQAEIAALNGKLAALESQIKKSASGQ